MKKITITLDEELARWAKITAKKRGVSLSRFVGELLREKMLEEGTYQAAMQQYLSQPPREFKSQGDKYPKRQELHER